MKNVFTEEIGSYEIDDSENKIIKSIKLNKPPKSHPNFEHSKLKDRCWRIDIYPWVKKDSYF